MEFKKTSLHFGKIWMPYYRVLQSISKERNVTITFLILDAVKEKYKDYVR